MLAYFMIFAVGILSSGYFLLCGIDHHLEEIVEHLRAQHPQVQVSDLATKAPGGQP